MLYFSHQSFIPQRFCWGNFHRFSGGEPNAEDNHAGQKEVGDAKTDEVAGRGEWHEVYLEDCLPAKNIDDNHGRDHGRGEQEQSFDIEFLYYLPGGITHGHSQADFAPPVLRSEPEDSDDPKQDIYQ